MVNQFKETAVYESTHGGVRGRGSNPPTYSICALRRREQMLW
jgi:hypothetical protein